MHPAEHRGLRELHAAARHLHEHWHELGRRLDGVGAACPPLGEGAANARDLMAELSAACATRGLYARYAAQGLGQSFAEARLAVVDPVFEVNQVLRFAVLDVTHVVVLLAYLARLAARRDDAELAELLERWEARMRVHEEALRAAAIAVGDDPATAIATATPGIAGRVGHALAGAVGTAGEWVDGRLQR